MMYVCLSTVYSILFVSYSPPLILFLSQVETQEMIACQQAAINIIHSQLQMATHGLMGFFGVAVIHQVNQAGRTLVSVLLNCKSPLTQSMLTEPAIEALRSCLVLLRRFSVRYLCGLRSADLIEEFCRGTCLTALPSPTTNTNLTALVVSGIPLVGAPPAPANGQQSPRRAWLRPVPKKQQQQQQHSTPGGSGATPDNSEPSPSQESGIPDVHDIFDLSAAAAASASASVSPSTLEGSSGSGGIMHSPTALLADASIHAPMQQQQQQQQQATFFSGGAWMSTSPGVLGEFGPSPRGGAGAAIGANGANGVQHAGDTDLLALLAAGHYDQSYVLGGLYSPDGDGFTGGHTDTLAGLNGSASRMQMQMPTGTGTGSGRSPEVGL